MSSISVAHLIRRGNDAGCLERFLQSYRKHPAGIDHELIFLLKGFPDGYLDSEIESLIASVRHEQPVGLHVVSKIRDPQAARPEDRF